MVWGLPLQQTSKKIGKPLQPKPAKTLALTSFIVSVGEIQLRRTSLLGSTRCFRRSGRAAWCYNSGVHASSHEPVDASRDRLATSQRQLTSRAGRTNAVSRRPFGDGRRGWGLSAGDDRNQPHPVCNRSLEVRRHRVAVFDTAECHFASGAIHAAGDDPRIGCRNDFSACIALYRHAEAAIACVSPKSIFRVNEAAVSSAFSDLWSQLKERRCRVP